MGAEPAVTVRDLVKRYPKSPVNAVDGVSFEVRRGEVFGLLGPNGREEDGDDRRPDDARPADERLRGCRGRGRPEGSGAGAKHPTWP